jgi:hypothetical protein
MALLALAAAAELRRLVEPEDPDAPPSARRVLRMFEEAAKSGAGAFPAGALVRAAEAACSFGEDGAAHAALAEFFGSAPPRDQHWVRAMFVHGLLRSREAAAFNGARRLALVREAVAFILQGLAAAEAGEAGGEAGAYGFLVYNASVHHWAVAGAWLRGGARGAAIPSLTRVCDALTRADDPDLRWRVTQHLALSACHAEVGALPAALGALGAAEALLARLPSGGEGVAPLAERALRLRAHYSACGDGKGVAEGTLKVPLPGSGAADGGGGKGGAPAAAAAAAAGAPRAALRASVWAALQPLLSVSGPGAGLSGYAHTVGEGVAFGGAALPAPAPPPLAPAAARPRLMELLKQLRPAAAAEHGWRAAQEAEGALRHRFDPPPPPAGGAPPNAEADLVCLVAQAAVQLGCPDVAWAAVRAAGGGSSLPPVAALLADCVDAQLLVGTCSVTDAHLALAHLVEGASSCAAPVPTRNNASAPRTHARLPPSNPPPPPPPSARECAVPRDVVSALAMMEEAPAPPPPAAPAAGAKGGKGGAPAAPAPAAPAPAASGPGSSHPRTRRASFAAANLNSLWPHRSSAGRALMLPGQLPVATTPLPLLTVESVAAVAAARRVAALKLLRRAVSSGATIAAATGDAFFAEFSAALTWNLALPLLGGGGAPPPEEASSPPAPQRRRDAALLHGALAAAADGLEAAHSGLTSLRVRLQLCVLRPFPARAPPRRAADPAPHTLCFFLHTHSETARFEVELDMLGAASSRLARAAALDYGGGRADPAYDGVPLPHLANHHLLAVPLPAPLSVEGGARREEHELSLQRPLDRCILPLAGIAAASLSVGAAGGGAAGGIAAVVELSIGRARAAREPAAVRAFLTAAGKALADATAAAEGGGGGGGEVVGKKEEEEEGAGAGAAPPLLRAPSFYTTKMGTLALLPESAVVVAVAPPAPPAAAAPPAKGGKADPKAVAAAAAPAPPPAPPPVCSAYPQGDAGASATVAARKALHRLWLRLAGACVELRQWAAGAAAAERVRGWSWDPQSRAFPALCAQFFSSGPFYPPPPPPHTHTIHTPLYPAPLQTATWSTCRRALIFSSHAPRKNSSPRTLSRCSKSASPLQWLRPRARRRRGGGRWVRRLPARPPRRRRQRRRRRRRLQRRRLRRRPRERAEKRWTQKRRTRRRRRRPRRPRRRHRRRRHKPPTEGNSTGGRWAARCPCPRRFARRHRRWWRRRAPRATRRRPPRRPAPLPPPNPGPRRAIKRCRMRPCCARRGGSSPARRRCCSRGRRGW